MQKIYLAGPDVFAPNKIKIGAEKKQQCLKYGYDAHYPLDQKFDGSTCLDYAIVKGNMKLIEESDIVLANLNNFRGTELHPACDSGTAWECGYGFGLNKVVIGYTNNAESIPSNVLGYLSFAVTGGIDEALTTLNAVIPARRIIGGSDALRVYTLDPDYPDILDADAVTAFRLGVRKGLGLSSSVHLTDRRSLVDKVGAKVDKAGYEVEDFNWPCNIMIAHNVYLY